MLNIPGSFNVLDRRYGSTGKAKSTVGGWLDAKTEKKDLQRLCAGKRVVSRGSKRCEMRNAKERYLDATRGC